MERGRKGKGAIAPPCLVISGQPFVPWKHWTHAKRTLDAMILCLVFLTGSFILRCLLVLSRELALIIDPYSLALNLAEALLKAGMVL